MTGEKPVFNQTQIGERQAKIGSIFIEYGQVRKVHEKLALLLETGRFMRKQTKRVQARVSLVEAPSSCGKSSAIEDFVEARKKAGEHDILFIELPPECTVKHMSIEFLSELKDPLKDKASSTLASNTRRIVSAIRNKDISLIIIDEFQDLMSAGNDRQARVSANWVKRVLDKAKVPVVCVGYPSMNKVISAVEGLESRTGVTLPLHPFQWNTDDDTGTFEFRAFLREFEAEIPCTDPSNLHAPKVAHAIHIASEGYVGRLSKLIVEAMEVSMLRREGADNITWEDLHEAHEKLHPDRENPFGTRRSKDA